MTLSGQSSFEEEQKSWRIMLSDFKICYKAIVIKTIQYYYKNKHMSMEQNR